MRFVIFSDLHDNLTALTRVLAEAEQHQADQLVFLGDAGRDAQLLDLLQQQHIPCVFGNWEVSGLRRMAAPFATWVGTWPAIIQQGVTLFCHATPAMPPAVIDTNAAARYIATGVGWSTLFPRLNRSEQARWDALAVLETNNLAVAFHGHTHVQEGWVWQADKAGKRQLRMLTTPTELSLASGPASAPTRYLIGVGSAGQPDDGPQGRYVIYDDDAQRVWLKSFA